MTVDRFDVSVTRLIMILVIVCGWTPSCRLSGQERANPGASPVETPATPVADSGESEALLEGGNAPQGIVLGVTVEGNDAV